MPQVSVVVPTYNRADLVSDTLESVAAQTFTDWECIVVDDGSTDGTRAVVEQFVARDSRFRYVWQENASASAARNHGLRLARGEFVTFLDSDDLFVPDKLEWQVGALERDPGAVLVYGNTFQFQDGDIRRGGIYLEHVVDKPSGWAFDALIRCSSIYSPTVRTKTIRALGGFDTRLPSGEDWDMWLTLSKVGTIIFDPRVSLYYRLHPGGKSNRTFRNYSCGWRIVNKHLQGLAAPKRARIRFGVWRYFQKGYTDRLQNEAYQAASAGDWQHARKVYRALAALSPRLLLQRGLLFNTLWALLPTARAPFWQTAHYPPAE